MFRCLAFVYFIFPLYCQYNPERIAWHFPGETRNRFPIVANGLIKPSLLGNGNEAIKKHLEKIIEANFSLAIVNCSPWDGEKKEGDYFELVAKTAEAINSIKGSAVLKLMIYDTRLTRRFPILTLAELTRLYEHRLTYGFFIDEPSITDFDITEHWVKKFNTADTSSWQYKKLFYVNLFGFHVYNQRYEKYVEDWSKLNPRVLSFDNHSLWDDEHAKEYDLTIGSDLTRDYFNNLEIFKRLSRKSATPFWNWISIHKHWSVYSKRFYRRSMVSDIRFQIFSSLAYGSKGILYYNLWNSPDAYNNGWHEEKAVLNYDGNETELYGEIQHINGKIKLVGDILLRLECEDVYHAANSLWSQSQNKFIDDWDKLFDENGHDIQIKYGMKLTSWNTINELPDDVLKTKIVIGMKNVNGMIGQLYDKTTNEKYFILVNKNRYSSQLIDFEISANTRTVVKNTYLINTFTQEIIRGIQKNNPNRIHFEYTLNSGDGVLFKLIQEYKP